MVFVSIDGYQHTDATNNNMLLNDDICKRFGITKHVHTFKIDIHKIKSVINAEGLWKFFGINIGQYSMIFSEHDLKPMITHQKSQKNQNE